MRTDPLASAQSRLLAFGLVASATVLLATPAEADIGVQAVHPSAGEPGDRVDLRLFCGGCPPGGLRLPVSLVPVGRAPEPQPCRQNAVCTPAAPAPPRRRPFRFLGRAGADSQLRFAIPNLDPGTYAFVIFCESCHRGSGGSLIADEGDRSDLLRIRGSGDPPATDAGGIGTIWWIVARGVAGALGSAALARRRRTRRG